MFRTLTFAFLLVSASTVFSAEPIKYQQSPQTKLATVQLPPAPTVEERLAELETKLSAQQQQITQLEQQLENQGLAIEMQSVDVESVDSRLASIEQAIQFENGVLIINVPEILMQADELSIAAPAVDISGNVTVGGIIQSAVMITDSVISKAYTPGAGNIW